MKVKLDEIFVDEDIYPRKSLSRSVVEAYLESLRAGEKFPPISVQRLRYEDGEVKTVLVDGLHRVEAYKRLNDWLRRERETAGLSPAEEVECEFWRDGVLDREEWLTQLQLESARLNAKHGLQLTLEDKKRQARKICARDPDASSEEIGRALGVCARTVREWVRDIKARQRAEREAIVYRLNLLGWTQEEMAEAIGRTQQRVSQILQEMADLPKLVRSFLERGDSVERVAEKLNVDVQLAWAIALEGLSDEERLEKLDSEVEGLSCTPRPYDFWYFSGTHDLFGYDYAGRLGGQVILQLLYFFTKQRDLIVDPMAGSGTVVHACLLMNRRCLAFDVNPECARRRVDVRVGDAIEAIKGLKRKADLIFLDPPFFKKKEREYGDLSISSLSREEYLDYLGRLAGECRKKLAPGGRLALIMSDYTEDDPRRSIFIHHYVNLFEEKGFMTERIIQTPYSSEQLLPAQYQRLVKSRKLAWLARYIVVFRASGP